LKSIIKSFLSFLGLRISRIPKTRNKDEFESNFHYREPNKWKWLKTYSIRSVLDIGSNEGQFAEKILEVFPNAEVHCFEPLQQVYNQLKENFKTQKNVIPYNLGLGENNEEKIINSNEYSPSSSLLEMLELHKTNFDFAVQAQPVQISIRRLDDIFTSIPASPLLVKIDVQGYEMQVLKGGEKTINAADVIIIETTFVPLYKDQPLFADIYSYFTSRGFCYAGNIEQLLAPINNQILQADAIFIKS